MFHSAITPADRAATLAALCKADQCDTRAFDNCFESGREEEVVAEFMKIYHRDPQLQMAALRNDTFISISAWQATAERVAAQQ